MSADHYPDRLTVRLPLGWRKRVEALAAQAQRSPSDWLRDLLRRTFESAERAERRRRAETK